MIPGHSGALTGSEGVASSRVVEVIVRAAGSGQGSEERSHDNEAHGDGNDWVSQGERKSETKIVKIVVK